MTRTGHRYSGRRRAVAAIAAAAGLGLATSGCSSLGKALGVGKNPPDEFAIVTKAPLVMPPDYSLRPPRPGEQRPQERQPAERAQMALFGDLLASGALSPGEEVLLQRAGAPGADPEIRKIINAEAGALADKSGWFADRIIFWRVGDDGEPVFSDEEKELIVEATGDAPVQIKKSGALALPGVR